MIFAFGLPSADQPSACLRMPRDQLALNRLYVGQRAIVGFARRLGLHISGGDDVQLVPQMIEGQQPVVEGEDAIGQLEIVFGVLGRRSNCRTMS